MSTLQDMGFNRIEIETGLTQTKVEALRSDVKLEVVYDQETGRIITQEQDRVSAEDDFENEDEDEDDEDHGDEDHEDEDHDDDREDEDRGDGEEDGGDSDGDGNDD